MPLTIDLTGSDDEAEVDALADLLASTLVSGSPSQPSSTAMPHASLQVMTDLAALVISRVAGDGNCAYHAACASLSETHLCELNLWPVQGGGHSASDMRLQREVRQRSVDFLQRDENKEHRVVGTSERNAFRWNEETQRWFAPPPPAVSLERHRRDGTYAQTPQLRAMAEVLRCVLVSLDSSRLHDRVPVFTCGQRQSLKLRSWREEIAPALSRGESLAPGLPTIVVVNNGRSDAGGHFDATLRRGEK